MQLFGQLSVVAMILFDTPMQRSILMLFHPALAKIG